MVELISVARQGLEARQELERRWCRLPEQTGKILGAGWREDWCDLVGSLGTGEQVGWLRQALRSAEGEVTDLFHQLLAKVTARLLDHITADLAKESSIRQENPSSAGEMLSALGCTELARRSQTGRSAENDLAGRLRGWLRDHAGAGRGAGLPTHMDRSDIAQNLTPKLLRWLVTSFRGDIDAQVWAAAKTALGRHRLEWEAEEAVLSLDDSQVAASVETPSAVVGNEENQQRIREAVDRLEETDRVLFRLHFLLAFSYARLAEVLGRGETEYTVRERVNAAKASFRTFLGAL